MARVREIELPWRQQPQGRVEIDPRWLRRGLRYVYAPWAGHDIDATITGTKIGVTQAGLARGFGSTHGAGTSDRVTLPLTERTTLRTYVIRSVSAGDGGGGGYGRLFDKRVSGIQVETLLRDDGGGRMQYSVQRTLGSCDWTFSLPPANAVTTLALAHDASSSVTDPTVYRDGVPLTVTNIVRSAGSLVTNSDGYVLGNRGDAIRHWHGWIGEVLVFDDMLSEEELRALSRDVNTVWAQRSIHVPVSAGSLSLPDITALYAESILSDRVSYRATLNYA